MGLGGEVERLEEIEKGWFVGVEDRLRDRGDERVRESGIGRLFDLRVLGLGNGRKWGGGGY